MREFFDDGIDRRIKSKPGFTKPTLDAIPITPAEIDFIVGSDNPKAALRAHYRGHLGSKRAAR